MRQYRVGRHYGIHVYQGDRPVATFVDPEEARAFVEAANAAMELARTYENSTFAESELSTESSTAEVARPDIVDG